MNDNRYLITDMCVDADPNKYTGFVHIEAVKESFATDISSYKPLEVVGEPEKI